MLTEEMYFELQKENKQLKESAFAAWEEVQARGDQIERLEAEIKALQENKAKE